MQVMVLWSYGKLFVKKMAIRYDNKENLYFTISAQEKNHVSFDPLSCLITIWIFGVTAI